MPRFPAVDRNVSAMAGGVFSKFAARIGSLQGEVYPFHVGDTWLEPLAGGRMEDLSEAAFPGMHRYGPPEGLPALRRAIADRHGVSPAQALVAAGGTGALKAAADALLEPGDEVLILAPYWPLIAGIVQTARGTPVEVPFWDRGAGDVAGRLGQHLTPRTVALYVNSPNNPTGNVLTAAELAALAEFARANGLWIWADEIYEHYAYASAWLPVAEFAPERTISAYSFSKAYGMAGNRCGYLVGPPGGVMDEIRKALIHAYYAAPTAAQLAGLAALRDGEPWLAEARALYRQAGESAAAALGMPAPEGGTFLFFDAAAYFDERGLDGFLLDCLDENLILAPGSSFGPHNYATCARLCFTAAPPEVTARGVAKLAKILAAKRRG